MTRYEAAPWITNKGSTGSGKKAKVIWPVEVAITYVLIFARDSDRRCAQQCADGRDSSSRHTKGAFHLGVKDFSFLCFFRADWFRQIGDV